MKCPQCQVDNPDTARFCESCGTRFEKVVAPPLPEPVGPIDPPAFGLSPGAMVAERFLIAGELGRGDMGPVYRATDTMSDKAVAVRLLRPDRLGKDGARTVIRECLMARDIRHPNVVAIYDAGEIGGAPYVVMELVEGQSLKAWLRTDASADLPLSRAMSVMRQLIAGVGGAHAQGVIHRNLKPGNVQLAKGDGDAPRVMITDFGLWRTSGVTQTATGGAGSSYMAPELISAPDLAQPPADIYSLCAIFYELLMHNTPANPWSPVTERADTPQAVDDLLRKGLSNNPKLRPQTAAAFLAELEAAIGPVVVEPPPKPDPVKAKVVMPEPQPPVPEPGPTPNPPPKPAPTPAPISLSSLPKPVLYGGIALLAAVAGGVAMMMLNKGGAPAPSPMLASTSTPLQFPPSPPIPTPQPLPPPPPPQPDPVPAMPNYLAFNGYWTDDFGGRIDVSVSGLGTVTGTVTRGQYAGNGFSGQFLGAAFTFQVGNIYGVVAASSGSLTDRCHITYQLVDAYGQPAGTSQIHINHEPHQPCP